MNTSPLVNFILILTVLSVFFSMYSGYGWLLSTSVGTLGVLSALVLHLLYKRKEKKILENTRFCDECGSEMDKVCMCKIKKNEGENR